MIMREICYGKKKGIPIVGRSSPPTFTIRRWCHGQLISSSGVEVRLIEQVVVWPAGDARRE